MNLKWLFEPESLRQRTGCLVNSRAVALRLWLEPAVGALKALPVLLLVCTTLLIGASYDPLFFQFNWGNYIDFFSSPSWWLFVCIAVLLSLPKLAGVRFELAVFVVAAMYLFFIYGDNLALLNLNGDNVCQVAYWNILSRPNLSGSLGASFPKPGQIIMLGALYQLSLVAGQMVFKIGLCLIMAACVWCLVVLAAEVGGRAAGILAFIVSVWGFASDFNLGESTIFLITSVFAGLRFYYDHPRWRSLGRWLIVLSLLFRVETVAVVAVVGVIHLVRREWLDLRRLVTSVLVVLLLFLWIDFRVQGSLSRINAGAAAGYVAPIADDGKADPNFRDGIIAYAWYRMKEDYETYYYLRFLIMLSLVGTMGAFSFRCERYLSVYATVLIILANMFLLGGTVELPRYFVLIYAIGCSIGVAALVQYGYRLIRRRRGAGLAVVIIMVPLLLSACDVSRLMPGKYQDVNSLFYTTALKITSDGNLPEKMRLLTEDDLLIFLTVLVPERLEAAASLQSFQVADTRKRMEILGHTDYVWIDNESYLYCYLRHLPVLAWEKDPFRMMIKRLFEGNTPTQSMYGFRFTRLECDSSHLLVKVEPSS